MAMAAIDVPHLAAFASVPESTLTTLLEAPTAELVQSFLTSISAKAREFEQVKSKNLRLDVELENAVRAGESKAKGLKNSVEKSLAENANLRDSLQKEGKPYSRLTLRSKYGADIL